MNCVRTESNTLRRRQSRQVIFFALVSFRLLWVNAPTAGGMPQEAVGKQPASADAPQAILMDCAKKDVTVSLVTTNTRKAPRPQHIELTYKGKAYPVHSLAQMKGYVDVKNSSQALSLVRLRTCLALRQAWAEAGQMVEIIKTSEITTLPDYHLPGYAEFLRNTLPQEIKSGSVGILSSEAYKAGRFTPASVRKVENGFLVTRWVLLDNSSERDLRLQKIQEHVRADGSYKRNVLLQQHPPNLPATTWVMPGFR